MMSINTLAAALELKPKSDSIQSQTKIKKLVRRNASDKLKLIQMVHDNPILWDSRLPNFKGAEEEKNRAWEQIGKEFNAPGRRVARAFKSLRESYRRELAHVKLMGNGFKPKWSLYDAMDFLRDVIRERKGGSHAAEHSIAVATLGLNLNSAFVVHQNGGENNNNRNNLINSSKNSSSKSKQNTASLLVAPATNFIEPVAALNLTKSSSTPLNINNDDFYNFIKPELDLSSHSNGSSMGLTPQPIVVNIRQQPQQQQQQQKQQQSHETVPIKQQQQQQHNEDNNNIRSTPTGMSNDSRVTSTHNDNQIATAATTTTTTTIRTTSTRRDSTQDAENEALDASDNVSMRSGEVPRRVSSVMGEVEELEAIDADFPFPYILDSNSSTHGVGGGVGMKRRRKELISDNEQDDDDYDTQMTKQHHRLRCQQLQGLCGNSLSGGMMLDIPPPQTVREVLNSKFCGFISAKLNSMEDSEADNLMNKILMLLVQTQTQTNDFK